MKNETEFAQAPEEKGRVSKKDVNYGPGVEGQDCLSCGNFKEPDRCSRVHGEISPSGTCDLWEMPDSVDGMSFGDTASIEDILFGPGE